ALGANGYGEYSGTSMAAPHVAGAILLLKEAFPNLTGRDLKMALFYTAVDLGTPGEDNSYGMGIINVPAAYQYLISRGNVPAAYNNDGGLVSIVSPNGASCDSMTVPEIEIENSGNANMTSLTITYTINPGNISNSFTWTGNLAPGQTSTVQLPGVALGNGVYDIEVTSTNPNGVTDERQYNDCILGDFTVSEAAAASDVNIGCPSTANLTASSPPAGATLGWYDAPSGGNQVGTGVNFTTPFLNTTTTYYADYVTLDNGAKTNNSGGGGNYTNDNRWLIFNALTDFKLKSVLVYASGAGNRNIQLVNNFGFIIDQVTINIPDGQQRVTLDFDVPAGNDYELKIVGNSSLYRNNNGVAYPYEIPGVLSVYTSNANSPLDFYYFFYDWEIEYGSACGRTPVTVTVSSIIAGIGQSATTVTAGQSVSFTDQTTPGPTVSWNWDFGDGNSSTQQNPTHMYGAPGNYTVTLITTDNNGCSDTATTTVEVQPVLNVDADALVGELNIYPNPAQNVFTIDMLLPSEAPVSVELYNAVGERVVTLRQEATTTLQLPVDISALANGVYFVRVASGDLLKVKQLVKK
ncbi:MAG: PKD domain-containing protein, partial [Bacteroidota bacterium]